MEQMRDALIRARAKGTSSVRFADGRQVVYQSSADMAETLADLESRIADFRRPRIGAVAFKTSKGL